MTINHTFGTESFQAELSRLVYFFVGGVVFGIVDLDIDANADILFVIVVDVDVSVGVPILKI